jgi:CRISPR-associated protein Cmr5
MAEQTLGQKRAAHALETIKKLEEETNYGNFGSYVQRLPATIVMNGLGQAMAGELAAARLAKGDKMSADERAHKVLFDCVESWLFKSGVYEEEKGLMAAIVEGSQDDYVRAQAEALAYLDWLKKFSQAYLNGDKDGSSTIPD